MTPADRAVAWLVWRRSRIAVLGALALCVAFPLVLEAVAALGVELPGLSLHLRAYEVAELSQLLLGLLVLPLFSGILGVLSSSGSAPGRDSWIARQPLALARTWLVRTATGFVLTAGIVATALLILSWLDPAGFDPQFQILVSATAVMGAMGFGAGLLGGTLAVGARAGLVVLGYCAVAFGACTWLVPQYFWMIRPMLAAVIGGFTMTALLATLVAEVRAEPFGRHRLKVALGATAACLLLLTAGGLPGAAALDRRFLPANVPCESFALPASDTALLRFFRFDGTRSWVVDTRAPERVLSLAPGHARAAAHPRRPWLAVDLPGDVLQTRFRVVVLDLSKRPAQEIGSWSLPRQTPPAVMRWVGDRLVTHATRSDGRHELLVFDEPFTSPPRRLLLDRTGPIRIQGAASADEVFVVTSAPNGEALITRVSLTDGSAVAVQPTAAVLPNREANVPGVLFVTGRLIVVKAATVFAQDTESPSGTRIAFVANEGQSVTTLDLATGTLNQWPVTGQIEGKAMPLGPFSWLDDEHVAWIVRRGSQTCVDMAQIPDPPLEPTCWVTDHIRLHANPLSGRLIASLDHGEGEASVFDLATRRWQELPPGRMYSWAGRDTLAVQTTGGGIGFAELATPDRVRWLQDPS